MKVTPEGENKFTFSGIGLYHPDLFTELRPGKSALAPLLKKAMQNQRISGEHYSGFWMDIGTPQRLKNLNHFLASNSLGKNS